MSSVWNFVPTSGTLAGATVFVSSDGSGIGSQGHSGLPLGGLDLSSRVASSWDRASIRSKLESPRRWQYQTWQMECCKGLTWDCTRVARVDFLNF